MKSLFTPALLLSILLGTLGGAFIYTLYYARGLSYLSDDPKACINCHVMNDQYNSWSKSTHHAITNCNSCHSPDNKLAKLFVKAINGASHSYAFTFNQYSTPIKIKNWNAKIVQNACLNCHQTLFETHPKVFDNKIHCIQCHKDIGHGK
jgi:cytochrome c nitrite reductase small subunit